MPHLFSIVTTTYNAESFILTALNSVSNQTETDYEYIIVDNGSTDTSFKIITNFIERHPEMNVKFVKLDKNKGISGGRNAGIEKTTGNYICFLDADDFWYPDKLAKMKTLLANNNYNVFCHWEDHLKDGLKTLGRYREINNESPYEDLLFNGNCLSTSAMVIQSSLIKNIGGFDENLVSGEEDYDCWLRLAKAGAKFFMYQEPLGSWLIRNDSISAKHIKHTMAVINMLDKHFANLLNENENTKMINIKRNKVKALNLCGCGRTLSLANDRISGNRLFKQAIKADPTYLKAYAGILLNIFHL